MKKTFFLGGLILLSNIAFGNYKVIISSDHNTYNVEEKKPPMYGYLIDLYSINNSSHRAAHDVTNTSHPDWEDNFSLTKDLVINRVSSYNQRITNTGVINWFDDEKKIRIEAQQACQSNDYAHSSIEYLDENDNIIFWTKTGDYNAYGTNMSYGKEANFSDAKNTSVVGQHPIVHGFLVFNKELETVSFDSLDSSSNYGMRSWILSNVEVSKIKKIRLSSSNVMTTYSAGTTCGAQLRLKIEKD